MRGKTLTESFVGRENELAKLHELWKKKVASFVVIRGRRRVGKSRLIEEFGKTARFFEFSGLPPTSKTTAAKQREEFLRQFKKYSTYSTLETQDWGDIFTLLAKETASGKVIILLDEISWMGSKDPTFLGKLKIAWDLFFKKNPQLILVVCGSVSSWIEKNILSHTGFVGRISLSMVLQELPLPDCQRLLQKLGVNYPPYEFFKLLGVTGGIPRYLEETLKGLSVEENIKRMCFQTEGLLYREFDQLFSTLFSKSGDKYKKIIQLLSTSEMETEEVAKALDYSRGGYVSNMLDELVKAGFLKKTYVWDIESAKEKKKPRFRLSDNYLRFYLRYIEPNRGRIERGHFAEQTLTSLIGWNTLMGLQFENLVLNNRDYIFKSLSLRKEDLLFDNPYIQKATKNQKGCQIDYLIHTRFHMLFLCEIRFSQNLLSNQVIEEVQNKIERFKLPRGYAVVPVLIHLNGISESVTDSGYFAHTVDFSKILSC